MHNIYDKATVAQRASERGLMPGTRLWAVGEKISGDAFRRGNSPSNPAIYLRWADLKVAKTGKIEGEDQLRATVQPGQGLSLFIERMIMEGFHWVSSESGQSSKAVLQKLAAEKGYTVADQINWFKLAEGKVMPSGLEVIYDGEPPGHCTLTVTRGMTVHEFLGLVNEHLGFLYVGTDIFGKN